jgi:tRNA pseudouridine38-40 synthase
MAHYQFILAYDGTEFQGFQRQKNVRTVQGVVEGAIRNLGWQGKTILSAGRTDTGVHASGQVVVADIDWRHSPDELLSALNAILPADVSAREIRIVPDDFHPRYDATGREYCYRILMDPIRQPILERYQWRLNYPVQPELLYQTACLFLGRHDFATYGTPPRVTSSTIREITLSHWVIEGKQLMYHVRANAFLYHMVRRLVFVQIAVASGKVDLLRLSSQLEEGIPNHPGIAPAHGLELVRVVYSEDKMVCDCNY